jgi:hypothetical protein
MNEKLKENSWKYAAMKYSGLIGSFVASCGIMSVFFWNLTNYRRQQRPAQVQACISTMLRSIYRKPSDDTVHRGETDRLCRFLESIDDKHPQLVFLTGAAGAGRSTVALEAARQLGSAHVVVELRGNDKSDPMRAIVKSCGATSLELCGDLYQFVEEISQNLKQVTGRLPTIILKPRGAIAGALAADAHGSKGDARSAASVASDLGLVLSDALTLVSDRHAANVIMELESDVLLALPHQHLPRTSIFHVAEMTQEEARAYLAKRLDPVAVYGEQAELLDVIGTNTVDLEDVVNSVVQHQQDVDEVICQKLSNAIRRIRLQELSVQAVLSEIAAQPFGIGTKMRSSEVDVALSRGLLTFNHDVMAFQFRSKCLYEAARIVGARA